MTCHQGRSSGAHVDAADRRRGAARRRHGQQRAQVRRTSTTTPAAATLFAGRAQGRLPVRRAGLRRPLPPRRRHRHLHQLPRSALDAGQLRRLRDCHTGVTNVAGAHQIRMKSSIGIDYDGDGNVTGGISDEVDRPARQARRRHRQRTASEHGTPICYAVDSYPYWFVDTDGDGACSADEAMASQRLHQLDRAPGARHLQLPAGQQRPGRLRPQRQVRHRAARTTRPPTSTRALIGEGRPEQGDPHRRRPLQRRRRGGSATGTAARVVPATCSVVPRRRAGLPLRRPVRRRAGGGGDRRTASSAAPATTARATDFTSIIAVPSVTFPSRRHARRARARQRLRELPPGPRLEGGRRRGDRGRQVRRSWTCTTCRPARSSSARRSTSATSTPARPTSGALSHIGGTQCTSCHDPVEQPPHLRDQGRLERPAAASATPTPTATRKNIRVIHTARLRRRRQHDRAAGRRDRRAGGATLAAMQAAAPAPGLCYTPDVYPLLLQRHQRRQELRRRRGGRVQRLQGLDARAHEGGVQLPALPERPGRLGAQLRLHGRSSSTTARRIWAATSAS